MKRVQRGILQGSCLLLSGGGIGWLIGLSVSPVVHIVVASVLAVVGGAVSALAGLEAGGSAPGEHADTGPLAGGSGSVFPSSHRRGARHNVTSVPLALFVVGLVSGAAVGIYARTHEWLGADPQRIVQKWRLTGLDDRKIARRLFDQIYPPLSSPADAGKPGENETSEGGARSGNPDSALWGNLYSSVPPQECAGFRSATGEDLRRLMQGSSDAHIRQFTAQCKEDACLEAAVKEILCAPSP